MYHSIVFQQCSDGNVISSRNTWDHWHLVPSSRPVFSPPAQKTRYIDIPGADGSLDMSEALTNYPVFENRKGSFEFLVINESDGLSDSETRYGSWHKRYSEILEYLHGKTLRAILEDDINYYYEGRFSVNSWASEKERSKIVIDYVVKPYKQSTVSSLDPNWLWDTLDFNDDTYDLNVSKYNSKTVSSSGGVWNRIVIPQEDLGTTPVCPMFNIVPHNPLNDIAVYYDDKIYRLKNGTHKIPGIVLYGKSEYTILFQGYGTVSIIFNEGRL